MKLITHSGKFHADDILSAVILSALHPEADIVRTRDYDLIRQKQSHDIVFDIGHVCDPELGIFDHHQKDRETRPEGTRGALMPYSSFGLIWKYFGKEFLKNRGVEDHHLDRVHAKFDNEFVLPIDVMDNGLMTQNDLGFMGRTNLGSLLELFNPGFENKDASQQDAMFKQAMAFAGTLVEQAMVSLTSEVKAFDLVSSEIMRQQGSKLLILPVGMPFHGALFSHARQHGDHGFDFVIHPGDKTEWIVSTVPKSASDRSHRKSFPESWAGLTGADLVKQTGIQGAKFCHLSRFMAATESKESAVNLANLVYDLENGFDFQDLKP